MSMSMRTRLKPVLSWIAVTLGCLAGFIACAEFGVGGVALSDRSPAWYLPWFGITGEALLGVGFLVGSLVALRNRRLAGIIFLAVMPVAAFCLAYPASGFLVWRADGGWFETPFPGTAIELAARGTPQRPGGTLAQGDAYGPPPVCSWFLRPGQSAHALGAE